MLQNLHTHSTFCDGKDTPEEMVMAAITKGFDSIGFSGHAPMCFGSIYDMGDRVQDYIKEIKRLKSAFGDRISVYLGCELDRYSEGLVKNEDFENAMNAIYAAFIN